MPLYCKQCSKPVMLLDAVSYCKLCASSLVVENVNSAQQLKAEILPLVKQSLERCINYDRVLAIETLIELEAKLSAV